MFVRIRFFWARSKFRSRTKFTDACAVLNGVCPLSSEDDRRPLSWPRASLVTTTAPHVIPWALHLARASARSFSISKHTQVCTRKPCRQYAEFCTHTNRCTQNFVRVPWWSCYANEPSYAYEITSEYKITCTTCRNFRTCMKFRMRMKWRVWHYDVPPMLPRALAEG